VRRGEASESEKKRLSELVEKLCEELEVLPFRGRLVKHLLVRRPRLLPKWATGVPDAVDKILALFKEYLSYVCDQAVWQNISKDPSKTRRLYQGYSKEGSRANERLNVRDNSEEMVKRSRQRILDKCPKPSSPHKANHPPARKVVTLNRDRRLLLDKI